MRQDLDVRRVARAIMRSDCRLERLGSVLHRLSDGGDLRSEAAESLLQGFLRSTALPAQERRRGWAETVAKKFSTLIYS